jgi:predicted deacylase
MIRHLLIAALVLLCAPAFAADQYCENDVLILDARFDGGRLDHCRFTAENSVELTFRTEDFGVDSEYAWFAFRVTARDSRDIDIRMHFPDSRARYWPKVSRDGKNWNPVDENLVERSEIGKSMTLRLAVDETGTWISAQELLTQNYYENWLAQLDAHYAVETSVIGQSNQGRPVHLAQTNDKPEAIVLLGRQHPAEVPGAIAMREFVDVVLGNSDLAREFRSRYMLLIAPLMNPDGVANGHARHNAGLTDINRDWGPFTQPETQSIAAVLDQLDERGIQPRLMLDFHATKMTPTMIFYTQVPEDDTDPRLFATNWMGQVAERTGEFEFTHDPRPPSGLDNTKNYFFSRYGIPAITYEIGDETDRQAIHDHTPAFAEEMMRVMLQAERP